METENAPHSLVSYHCELDVDIICMFLGLQLLIILRCLTSLDVTVRRKLSPDRGDQWFPQWDSDLTYTTKGGVEMKTDLKWSAVRPDPHPTCQLAFKHIQLQTMHYFLF